MVRRGAVLVRTEISGVILAARIFFLAWLIVVAPLLARQVLAQGQSQGTPLACTFIKAGGLDWDGNQWNVTEFKLKEPFILVFRGEKIDPNSVKRALRSSDAVCAEGIIAISCLDRIGTYLLFDPQTNRGSVASLFGGTEGGKRRDSLVVSPFICHPF
jgi:hypothetical protein